MRGTLFFGGSSDSKDPTVGGTIAGSPIFGNPPTGPPKVLKVQLFNCCPWRFMGSYK